MAIGAARAARSHSARAFLAGIVLATLTALVANGCEGGKKAAPAPLRLTIIGLLSAEVVERDADALAVFFGGLWGRPVVIVPAGHAAKIATDLEAGKLDVAIFSPLRFVIARREIPALQPLARIVLDGVESYRGVIISRREAGPKDLEGLRGTRVCWVATSSTSGYLYPRAVVRAKGLEPNEIFTDAIFTGGHQDSIEALLANKCDVAATFPKAYQRYGKGIPPDAFNEIAFTEPIPFDPIVARPGLDPETVAVIRDGLLGAVIDQQELPPGLAMKKLSGFLAASLTDYEEVRRVLEQELAARPVEKPF